MIEEQITTYLTNQNTLTLETEELYLLREILLETYHQLQKDLNGGVWNFSVRHHRKIEKEIILIQEMIAKINAKI